MISNLKKSLSNINYKLFFALLILGFCPTVYSTLRVFFLGQLPGDYAFSLAGQLSWVNLIYEVLNEAIILPLYYFVKKESDDKKAFSDRVYTGMVYTFLIYTALSGLILLFADELVYFMAVDKSILWQSAMYIRIESVANIFGILAQFALVVLVSVNRSRYIYILTGAKLVMSVLLDTFFVSTLPVSLNLGVNGIGYSNIIVNFVIFVIALILLHAKGDLVYGKGRYKFAKIGDYYKVGGISGLESLVRNAAYMLMIVRMMNVVGEQGTYWVANNFIWGWLLLPVLQLGELIKKETAEDVKNVKRNTPGYLFITFVISISWFVSIPIWKPFMANVLQFSDVDKLFELVLILIGFYVLFAFQNIFDATFYGLGKTNYMLFESVVTNTVFYGTAFILYLRGVWTPTLTGIALLFGLGMAFDSVVSFAAYVYLLKKQNRLLEKE